MSRIFGLFNKSGEPVYPTSLVHLGKTSVENNPKEHPRHIHTSIGCGCDSVIYDINELPTLVPLSAGPHSVMIAADIRLDNRHDLMEYLGLIPKVAHDIADSNLVIKAYQKWGIHSFAKLNGDFSFAL